MHGWKTRLSLLTWVCWLGTAAPACQGGSDPLDDWQWSNPQPQGNSLLDIAYGNNVFVAVGAKTIISSFDGAAWSVRDKRDVFWYSVAFGNGTFVALGGIGGNRVIETSRDAVTWSAPVFYAQNTNGLYELNRLVYENGQFLAVGFTWAPNLSGIVATSPDGLVWTNQVLTNAANLLDITYGGGNYVAVGHSGTVLISADAKAWVVHNVPIQMGINSIAFGNGTFVATVWDEWNKGFPPGYLVWTSPDGINWTSRGPSPSNSSAVRFQHGLFFACSGPVGGTPVSTSTDGVNWKTAASGSVASESVIYGAGTYVAVGDVGTVAVSLDGTNWLARSRGVYSDFYGIAYGGGRLVAVGDITALSINGSSWMQTGPGALAVAYGNGTFVEVGPGTSISTSPDGSDWVEQPSPATNGLRAVTFGGGLFIVVGDGGTILTSPDGIRWTYQNSSVSNLLSTVAYGNGIFVVGGGDYVSLLSTLVVSTDGSHWRQAPSKQSFRVLTFGEGRFLGMGSGDFVLSSADGLSWNVNSLPSGMNMGVFALAYGGGTFVSVGVAGQILTSPDGIQWTARASGTTAPLFGVAFANGSFFAVGVEQDAILRSGNLISPTLGAVYIPNNGSFHLSIAGGTIGGTYRLQANPNLGTANWTDLSTFTNSATNVDFEDALTQSNISRFYRLISP